MHINGLGQHSLIQVKSGHRGGGPQCPLRTLSGRLEPKRTMTLRRSAACNGSGRPIIAEQGRNLDPVNQSSF